MMEKLTFQELQRNYLIKVYELTEGNAYKEISFEKMKHELKLTENQEMSLVAYFGKTDLVHLTLGSVMLSPHGIIKVEEYMGQDYADKELLVLKTIYELSEKNPSKQIHYSELGKVLNIPPGELIDIITELHSTRKGYLGAASDEHLKVSPAGKEFLQGKSNMPKNTGDTYNTHNYGPSNNQIGGHHNTQYNQMNLNPDFEKIIAPILDLIHSSEMSQPDKDEFIQDIKTVNRLITENPERAKAKFDYIGTALKATDIGVKLLPYMSAIYTFLESLINHAK